MTLKEIAEAKELSLYEIAKKSGISYSSVNYISSGRTPIDKIKVGTLSKIADALGLTMDELYHYMNSKNSLGYVKETNTFVEYIPDKNDTVTIKFLHDGKNISYAIHGVHHTHSDKVKCSIAKVNVRKIIKKMDFEQKKQQYKEITHAG